MSHMITDLQPHGDRDDDRRRASHHDLTVTRDTVDLRAVLWALVSRWWLVVPLVLLTGFAGYQGSSALPTSHEAAATLIVGQTTQGAATELVDIQASERLAFTYADLAVRQPTLSAVVSGLGLDMTWQELGDMVSVKRVSDTPLIEIRVVADSPQLAQDIAAELTDRIIALSPTETARATQSYLIQREVQLRTRIEIVQEEIVLAQRRLRGTSSAERAATLKRITRLEAELEDLEATHSALRQDLRSDRWSNAIEVFQPARANTSPLEPNRKLNAVLAAAVGLLLAVAIVAVLEARRRYLPRLRSRA